MEVCSVFWKMWAASITLFMLATLLVWHHKSLVPILSSWDRLKKNDRRFLKRDSESQQTWLCSIGSDQIERRLDWFEFLGFSRDRCQFKDRNYLDQERFSQKFVGSSKRPFRGFLVIRLSQLQSRFRIWKKSSQEATYTWAFCQTWTLQWFSKKFSKLFQLTAAPTWNATMNVNIKTKTR